MTTTAIAKTSIPSDLDPSLFARIIEEGYGPGAWHGADLKAALADVTSDSAFRRPAPGRHNVAEIALHHAYCTRSVRAQLSGATPEPFVLEGDDWFPLSSASALTWDDVLAVTDAEQRRLATLVADIASGRVTSPLTPTERFDILLGITCHAIYHAGQVQLVKRMV